MRISRTAGVMLASLVALCLFLAVPASAQQSSQGSPCAPGQPPDRGPGVPPGSGQPSGRPPYPPGKCQLLLSSGTAAQGSTLTAAGAGFAPGEEVTLRLNGSTLQSVNADSAGAFSAEITVPANAAVGASTVTATSATQVLSASLEVTPAAGATEGSRAAERARAAGGLLSRTGADVLAPAVAGIALVGVGALLVAAARRRRTLPAT